MGIYAASKHAVEGYTETLDHEVRRFGVRAILVEPYLTKTKIGQNETTARISLQDYAIQRKRMSEVVHQGLERGDDPRIVAEAVYEAVTAKSPRLRYAVGQGVALSRLRRFVPAGIFDRNLRKQFQLD
jgi:short-subunit dehydrogenase